MICLMFGLLCQARRVPTFSLGIRTSRLTPRLPSLFVLQWTVYAVNSDDIVGPGSLNRYMKVPCASSHTWHAINC